MVQTHEERKAQQREYYQKNKERYRKNEKLWREKNREKIKEYARNRRASNLEEFRKHQRDWHRKNPEKSKAAGKRYYHSHKENSKNYYTKWVGKNREYYLEQNRKYNKKHSKDKQKWNYEKRLVVITHYSKKSYPECSICHEKNMNFLQIDHINGVMRDDGRGGSKLVNYLIKNEFPKGYQILCGNCNWLKEFQEKEKELSTKRENVMAREKWQNNKKEVFEHYSKGNAKCVCCGFDNIVALTIDHIEGRKNAKHRKTDSGRLLYYWIKRNDYPKDFQVLCVMCNTAKGSKPKCPHQK